MVNLSLDLFRMEEGTYRLRAQAVDLAALVQTVSRELEAHARSKTVRWRWTSRRARCMRRARSCFAIPSSPTC